MPRLLAINNYYYARGGAEVVFFEHNRLFEAMGWEVVPFAMQHAKNYPSMWSKYFVKELEYGYDYSFYGKVVRAVKSIYSVEARRKLSRLIDIVQPDISHLHNIYHHISPSILGLLKDRGVPVVLTLHDLKIACPAYKMMAPDGICERCKNGKIYNVFFYRCLKGSYGISAIAAVEASVHSLLGSYSNHVDRFVVPSRFYIEKFAEWGWDKQNFVCIPNFVDVESLRPEYGPGHYFLYFGRLSEEKGISTLIKAVSQAGVSLKVVGSGPEEPELRKLADTLGARIEFLGYLSGSSLHDAIRASRAVVVPSEWYENAPMSLMEAYAFGKPVIGAAIGGIPELIRSGETGAMFEAGSIESLASKLIRFKSMADAEISEMGRAGRIWVEGEFSKERYRDRISDVYSELGVRS